MKIIKPYIIAPFLIGAITGAILWIMGFRGDDQQSLISWVIFIQGTVASAIYSFMPPKWTLLTGDE